MAYTIQQGDTLSGLSKKYGTTLPNLLALNKNITDPNKIQAGASLNLPPTIKNTSTGTQVGGTFYPNVGNASSAIGVKTKSPTDNLKAPPNITPTPQVQKPIAGGTTTEGGTQNTNTIQTPTPTATTTQPYSPTNTGLFGQLVAGLANAGQSNPQADTYRQQIQDLQNAQAEAFKNLDLSGIDQSLATGQENILGKTFATKIGAAQQGLANALQQQTLKQQALQQAGGLAQPILGAAGQVPFSPVTGGQGNILGGQGGGFDINSLAKQVAGGQMTIDQANSALGNNIALTGALRNAITQINPNFNFAQSSTLAAQQGSITPAYNYAKIALNNLQNAVGSLGSTQNTNIPIINQITQGLSTTFGVGSQAVQAYKGALAEARSAIQKVLASVQGGTPTDYVGQSNALLPDNATPNQIAAASQTLDTLGQAKVGIYGSPGQSTTTPTTSTSENVIQTPYGNINPNL